MDVQNVNRQGGKNVYYIAEIFIHLLQVILCTIAVMSHIVRNRKIYEMSMNFPGDSFVLHYSHNT